MKTNTFTKLFKSVISLLMVLTLLLGCGLVFAGCAIVGDKDDENNKGTNYENLTPSEYFQKLELENADGLAELLTGVYGSLEEFSISTANGAEMGYSLQVGNQILDMLEDSYFNANGEKMDFSFLSKVNLDVALNGKDKLQQLDMAVGLGDKRILTICAIMNLEDFTTWVGLPELSDVFAEMNLVQLGQMGSSANMATLESAATLIDTMPSEQEFNALIKRYLEVALNELKNVERKTVTLELDGLKQECTALSLKICEKDALNAVTSVLKTAKDDSELKQILDKFGDAFNDLMAESYKDTGVKWEKVDLYEGFKEAVEEALESLDIPDEEMDTEEYIELITYVDSAHSIIGRKLSKESFGDEAVYYYTVTEGNAFTFEATVAELAITGSGTKKSGEVDAKFKLNIDGSDLVELEVEDWNATKNSTKGRLVIEPTAELISMMFGDTSALPYADIALELKIDTDDSAMNFEINLLSNDAMLVGIAVDAKSTSGGAIKVPSKAIDFNNQNQVQAWIEHMDFEKLIQNLRDAGVPNELLELLESDLTV